MILKKKEFFLLIFLIFLQSCSGGRIGNFLESSFKDLEKTSQNENLQKNLVNKQNLLKENKEIDQKKNKKIKKVEKPKNVLENKKDINFKKIPKQKNNKIKNSTKNRKIELHSYKIIYHISQNSLFPTYFALNQQIQPKRVLRFVLPLITPLIQFSFLI